MNIELAASKAKSAAIRMAALKSDVKNAALQAIAQALVNNEDAIIAANALDLEAAKKANLAPALQKRLKFDSAKIKEACQGLNSLVNLPDPVGQTLTATELTKGLELYKVTSPIGVIGVIFESRPDALVQISSLCLKSSNACLLKGGAEAANTNRILADTIYKASVSAGLPEGWLTLVETRQGVMDMLQLDRSIDLLIPRGSNEFVRYIMDNTNIPVMGHAAGICHVYIDKSADLDMAVNITVDSKCQYTAVCNAAETLLVHELIAPAFLPRIKAALQEKGVEIRGDDRTCGIISANHATDEDWATEYLDSIISIKVVGDLDAAIDHINTYSSKHTDAIITADKAATAQFLEMVDSADVFWNASTRFADGFRFGLGAEVGISTSKIHARGPVGLEGLVIYKYKLIGTGQIVADYSGPNAKKYTHAPLKKDFKI